MRLLPALLLTSLTLAPLACEPASDCPAFDCADLLELDFAGENGELPPSTYEIVIEIRDEQFLVVCGSEGEGWICEDPDGPMSDRLSVHAIDHAEEGTSFSVQIEGGFGRDGVTEVGVSVIAGDAPLLDEVFEFDFQDPDDPDADNCESCISREQRIVL